MLLGRRLIRNPHRECSFSTAHPQIRKQTTRAFDPLRILFCGSDIFSIASLNALHDASQQDRTFIESIQVVSRPPKRKGSGKKKVLFEVPIAERARTLKLPLYQLDTFKGWTPPSKTPINLILAVSFGLLIPRRIIEGAQYGGLNVHPSMLPDLWGAAPLQHALLDGDKHTGITVQTLHPTTMDKGAIIAQTPAPGTMIPEGVRDSFASLTECMAPLGADLLLETLRQGLFREPMNDLSPQAVSSLHGLRPRHARKLGLDDRHIDWNTWSADRVIHYQRLFGMLWSTLETESDQVKIVWSSPFQCEGLVESNNSIPPGLAYLSQDGLTMLINTADGKTLSVSSCTVAGDKSRDISAVVRKYELANGDNAETTQLKAPFK